MRHRKNSRKLSRNNAHRKAVLKNLVKSLLDKQRITTTLLLAKESRRLAEKLITMGKRGDVAARRRAFSVLNSRDLVKLLFSDIAPRFANRAGGYTRIIRLGTRHGDNAKLAILELTEIKEKDKKASKSEKEVLKKEDKAKIKEIEHIEKPKKKEQEAPKVEPKEEEAKEPQKQEEGKGFLGGLKKFLKKQDKPE